MDRKEIEQRCRMAKVKGDGVVSEIHSLSIDWNGWNFIVIYGKGPNGWFIAIPNWKVCIECAPPDNVRYNAEKLEKQFAIEGPGVEIAKAIGEYWEKQMGE